MRLLSALILLLVPFDAARAQDVTWRVSAGHESFAFRDIARSKPPVDASPVVWRGGGPAVTVGHERSPAVSPASFRNGPRPPTAASSTTQGLDVTPRPPGDSASRSSPARYDYRRSPAATTIRCRAARPHRRPRPRRTARAAASLQPATSRSRNRRHRHGASTSQSLRFTRRRTTLEVELDQRRDVGARQTASRFRCRLGRSELGRRMADRNRCARRRAARGPVGSNAGLGSARWRRPDIRSPVAYCDATPARRRSGIWSVKRRIGLAVLAVVAISACCNSLLAASTRHTWRAHDGRG